MPAHQVVEEEGAQVADVGVVPDRRTARVHAHVPVLERLELVFGAGEGVVQPQRHAVSLA